MPGPSAAAIPKAASRCWRVIRISVFRCPSVWYEAQLSAPGFELYGYHNALVPVAFLGHNLDFGWSLTMFQNDDLDLVAEKVNPDNPNQVWYHDQWVDMSSSEQQDPGQGPGRR